MDISGLARQMVLLFGVILIGFMAAKIGLIDQSVNQKASLLLNGVVSPMQVISSALSGARPVSNKKVFVIIGIVCLIYLALIAAARLFPVIFRIGREKSGVYQCLLIFANVGFMGYPVVEALFGKSHMFYATLIVVVFQLFCWTYGVSLMSGEMKLSVKTFTRPTFVAAVIALILYLVKIPEIPILYRITDTVGSMTSPLAMLISGCALAQLSFKEVFGKWRIYALSVIKLILFPVAGFFILRLFIKEEALLGTLVVSLAMPAGMTATTISYQYGGDTKSASAGVFVTTLLSVVTIPLIMWLLFVR